MPPLGGQYGGGCRMSPARGCGASGRFGAGVGGLQRALSPVPGGGPGVGGRRGGRGAWPGFVAGGVQGDFSGLLAGGQAWMRPRSGGPAPQECGGGRGGSCARIEVGVRVGRGGPRCSPSPRPAAHCLPSTKMAGFVLPGLPPCQPPPRRRRPLCSAASPPGTGCGHSRIEPLGTAGLMLWEAAEPWASSTGMVLGWYPTRGWHSPARDTVPDASAAASGHPALLWLPLRRCFWRFTVPGEVAATAGLTGATG